MSGVANEILAIEFSYLIFVRGNVKIFILYYLVNEKNILWSTRIKANTSGSPKGAVEKVFCLVIGVYFNVLLFFQCEPFYHFEVIKRFFDFM